MTDDEKIKIFNALVKLGIKDQSIWDSALLESGLIEKAEYEKYKFKDTSSQYEAELYLRNCAKDLGYSYEYFLDILQTAQKDGTYCFGYDEGPEIMYNYPDIWDHYQQIVKTDVDHDVYFRCAC